MQTQKTSVRLASFILPLICMAGVATAGDWPRWGRDNSCNMVSDEKNLPDWFSPGVKAPPTATNIVVTVNGTNKVVAPTPIDNKFGSGIKNPDANLAGPQWSTSPRVPDVDPSTVKNVRWVARLATHCYGSPVVTGGRVFVGTNSDQHRHFDHTCNRCINFLRVYSEFGFKKR